MPQTAHVHTNGATPPVQDIAPAELSKAAIESKAQQHSQKNKQVTAWDSPGPASFDLRSDTITTPTASMLQSIASTTLLDDVFLEDPATNSFQKEIACKTGFQNALLVTSGTQGNQLALRASLDCAPPYSILVDSRSHIYGWEAGGAGWLSNALIRPVMPRNGHHLTVEDVEEHAILTDDVHAAPTKLVCLENTLAGTVIPPSDIAEIASWCREKKIHLHCDGARLWEAVVATELGSTDAVSLEVGLRAQAKLFDSISLCFSKGLGAPIGSILVGKRPFIKRARHLRKAMGGGMRQAGILAAPMNVAFYETFLGGKLSTSHANAREVASRWEGEAGGKLQKGKPVETNMVWCDLNSVGLDTEAFVKICGEEGLRVMGGRLVVHYQIEEEALQRWKNVCKKIGALGGKKHELLEVDINGEGKETKRMKLNVE